MSLLNTLKSVFNAGRPAPDPAPASPPPGVPIPPEVAAAGVASGQLVPAIKVSPRPPATLRDADAWTARFVPILHTTKLGLQITNGRPYCPRPEHALKVLAALIDENEPLLSGALLDEMKANFAEDSKCEQQIIESAAGTVRAKFLGQLVDPLDKGDQHIHGHTALEQHFAARRKALNDHRQQISERTVALVQPACELLRDAARKKASALADKEQADAAKFDIAFLPSPALTAFIWVGLIGAMMPAESVWLRPCADPKRFREYWVPPPGSVGKSLAEVEREKAAERRRALDAAQGVPVELTEAERKKKLEEINAVNDAARLSNPLTPEDIAEAEKRGIIPNSQVKRITQEQIDAAHRRLADAAKKGGK